MRYICQDDINKRRLVKGSTAENGNSQSSAGRERANDFSDTRSEGETHRGSENPTPDNLGPIAV